MFMFLLALLCTGRWHILMRPTRLLVGGSISSYNSGSVSPAVFSLLPGRRDWSVFGPYSSHSACSKPMLCNGSGWLGGVWSQCWCLLMAPVEVTAGATQWGLSLLFTSMLLVGIWRGRLCADSVLQRQGYVVCHKLCICPSQVPNDAFHAKVAHLLVQLLICWLMGYCRGVPCVWVQQLAIDPAGISFDPAGIQGYACGRGVVPLDGLCELYTCSVYGCQHGRHCFQALSTLLYCW
jgi:hypothetical protein